MQNEPAILNAKSTKLIQVLIKVKNVVVVREKRVVWAVDSAFDMQWNIHTAPEGEEVF